MRKSRKIILGVVLGIGTIIGVGLLCNYLQKKEYAVPNNFDDDDFYDDLIDDADYDLDD